MITTPHLMLVGVTTRQLYNYGAEMVRNPRMAPLSACHSATHSLVINITITLADPGGVEPPKRVNFL